MKERAKLDDHKDKVADLMSHLLELGVVEEKVPMPSVAASCKPVEKQLGSLAKKKLQSIN